MWTTWTGSRRPLRLSRKIKHATRVQPWRRLLKSTTTSGCSMLVAARLRVSIAAGSSSAIPWMRLLRRCWHCRKEPAPTRCSRSFARRFALKLCRAHRPMFLKHRSWSRSWPRQAKKLQPTSLLRRLPTRSRIVFWNCGVEVTTGSTSRQLRRLRRGNLVLSSSSLLRSRCLSSTSRSRSSCSLTDLRFRPMSARGLWMRLRRAIESLARFNFRLCPMMRIRAARNTVTRRRLSALPAIAPIAILSRASSPSTIPSAHARDARASALPSISIRVSLFPIDQSRWMMAQSILGPLRNTVRTTAR